MPSENLWTDICDIQDIPPNTGVCAQLNNQQIAIFYLHPEKKLKSIDNFDPIAKASVLSRGIVAEIDGKRVVASPLYKQHFCLDSGRCLQDDEIQVATYQVRMKDNKVQALVIEEEQ
ncbi:nitrite reductase small subunit NirD [Aliikangiella coralliicola]|uniref:Nitrite reductase small subunit NirD n=2 Tax=Aliikangiella coralliicola TaxID=2592383 RepID=A0A545U6I5_9GAMM|nr:nitrite reductase small subunit NirD [Aliikangiella coralliicola]